MPFGMKGMARDWGPGIVRISGGFTSGPGANTVTLSRPNRPGFTVTQKATGVYLVTLTQAFLSVADATVTFGPAASTLNAALPTAIASGGFGMITQDFFTANAANYIPDATGKNLVITVFTAPTGGSLVNVAANYRCDFEIILCESAVNK